MLVNNEKHYNLEQAQEEAQKIQEKIENGKAKNYDEANKLVDKEKDQLQKALEYNLMNQKNIDAAGGVIRYAFEKGIPLDFDKPEIVSGCQESLEYHLNNGNFDSVEKIIYFTKSKNIKLILELDNPELISTAYKRLTLRLSNGEIDSAVELIEFFEKRNINFELTKPEIFLRCQEGLEKRLIERHFDYVEKIINFATKKEIKFNLTDACQKSLEYFLSKEWIFDEYKEIIKFAEKKNISLDIAKAIDRIIINGNIKPIIACLGKIPNDILELLEKKHFLLSYQKDLNLPAVNIYQKYVELKRQGDEMQTAGYIEKIKQQRDNLISSDKQSPEMTKMENYQELMKAIYPNHAKNWTNFENNESCPDRSDDLKSFKIRDKYELDLAEGVEMVLKQGKEKDGKAVNELEKPIAKIQQKFAQVGFEKEKMFNILDKEIEQKISFLSHQEIFKTREEKLYGLLLESLVNKFNSEELKELLIAYQFAEFEDIRNYLEGTRAQAEQAKNPDYAYLLELREFFADRLKEVERKIAQKAQESPEITKILPEYYQEKREQEKEKAKKGQLDRLRVKDLGLDGNLLERILKELSKKTDKNGGQFNLVEEDEKGNIVLDKKGQGIVGVILSEQRKAAKVIETMTGEKVNPENIHLGELNLQEYLKAEQMMQKGEYDEELFSRYVLQAFQGIFEKELTTIDKEVAKYQPKEEVGKGKKQKKLECFITKNHTSAHARAVGGVCVAGDNPKEQGEECQWNMPNYFQLVLRDSESKVCQGLVLLHYYEDKGKKILTVAFDPCSTYLYQVDEKQLFKGLLKQLEVFTQDNDIDIIAVSQNKAMRTNRTGGEFERTMENQIRNLNQTYSLDEEKIFSYNPKYIQKDLDVVWAKK